MLMNDIIRPQQLIGDMFNPSQFIRPPTSRYVDVGCSSSGRIVIERMTDHSKTRWDEPLSIPEVLYQKFNVAGRAQTTAKQSKKYPISLLEYIKRAYSKCKNDLQARAMDGELRKIIAKHQQNLQAVDWAQLPLPSLQQQRRSTLAPTSKQPMKRDLSSLPKEYIQSLGPKEELPSHTKEKISKTLQKLEEKLSKKQQGKLEPQTKTFIGFKKQPESYHPTVYRSQISPHLRTVFLASTFPPPPPKKQPEPKPQELKPTQVEPKYSKPSKDVEVKQKPHEKLLNVVVSTSPQKPRQKPRQQKIPKEQKPVVAQGQGGRKGKVVMTRKELTEIAKVATKVGDVYNVAKRYESFNKLKVQSIKSIAESEDQSNDYEEIIVGRNTNIDKPYLRITGRPDPDFVRPQPVLRKALSHFLSQHKSGAPYDSLISQFKSIRQDLTVQHIRNSFTVEVYQQNLKMSLFQNDVIQVKQCQANLWQLYRQGHYKTLQSRNNFISYHFLTLILQGKDKELQYMLTLLPQGTIDHPVISQTLRLKRALLAGNYRAFFDFCNNTDPISCKMLNFYIDKIRMKFLLTFSKTCGQKATFGMLSEIVGEDEDVLQALAIGEGAVVRQGNFMLKQSYQALSKSQFLVVKKVTNLLI